MTFRAALTRALGPCLIGLAGCTVPGTVAPGADLTVASLLSGGSSAVLVDLTAGGREVQVPRGPSRSAFMMLNYQNLATDKLAVSINFGASAFKLAGLGAPAAGAPFEAASPPWAGDMAQPVPAAASTRSFEARLRQFEAPLRQMPRAPQYGVLQTPSFQRGDREEFWVIADLQDGQSTEIKVTARAVYVGPNCYVFLDDQIPDNRLDQRIAQIGDAFESKIYPTDVRIFGEPVAAGVNGDPKITLLISPVVGNYGKDSTIGYFTLRDLFAPGADTKTGLSKHSNQRLMLYVSPFVVSKGQAADYLGTIAHEFQHLINASQKLSRHPNTSRTEELWLDESLSMYAMEANGYGLNGSGSVVFSHVAAYLGDPGAYSLTDWESNPQQSGYGAGYLFSTYMVDRFGEGLLKELVSSGQTGIPNLNARLLPRNTSFRQVFDDWTGANLLDDTGLTSDPRYNYKNVNLLGAYGPRKLNGMHLDSVQLPRIGQVNFKPYSAQYFFLPVGDGQSLTFSLKGSLSQDFGGLVVAP